jgi:hypothetical protein
VDLHIGLLDADGSDSETLKLATRKESNITVINVAQFCRVLNQP